MTVGSNDGGRSPLILFGVALVSCATTTPKTEEIEPQQYETYATEYWKVFGECIDAASKLDWEILKTDEDAGVVQAHIAVAAIWQEWGESGVTREELKIPINILITQGPNGVRVDWLMDWVTSRPGSRLLSLHDPVGDERYGFYAPLGLRSYPERKMEQFYANLDEALD